jgi:hypothetical protein
MHRTTSPMHRTTSNTTADAWPPERLDRLTRGMFAVVFGRPAPPAPAGRCEHGAPLTPAPMDEIERFRWELIADETIDRAFAEAGVDELLAEVAAAQDEGDGELQAARES